jgi:hypothetical protein
MAHCYEAGFTPAHPIALLVHHWTRTIRTIPCAVNDSILWAR